MMKVRTLLALVAFIGICQFAVGMESKTTQQIEKEFWELFDEVQKAYSDVRERDKKVHDYFNDRTWESLLFVEKNFLRKNFETYKDIAEKLFEPFLAKIEETMSFEKFKDKENKKALKQFFPDKFNQLALLEGQAYWDKQIQQGRTWQSLSKGEKRALRKKYPQKIEAMLDADQTWSSLKPKNKQRLLELLRSADLSSADKRCWYRQLKNKGIIMVLRTIDYELYDQLLTEWSRYQMEGANERGAEMERQEKLKGPQLLNTKPRSPPRNRVRGAHTNTYFSGPSDWNW